MRTLALILATATAAALISGTAWAEDFTGPRVEIVAGYDAVKAKGGIAGPHTTIEGVRLGGAAGYDMALGETLRVGVEGGFGFNLSGKEEVKQGATTIRAKSGRDLDASLRIGAKVAENTLIYAKAGYANTQFRGRVTTVGTASTTVVNAHDDEDGYRIGAGVEQNLSGRVYAKAELRYTGYGHGVSRKQALLGAGVRF
jgi:outer membrane immunogenic protein